MFSDPVHSRIMNADLCIVIDPAAGGPQSDYAFVTFTRLRGIVKVVGAEVLSGCKEPTRQFDLVADHTRRLRQKTVGMHSRVLIYVERTQNTSNSTGVPR